MLNSLPDIRFVTGTSAEIEASIIGEYEKRSGHTLAPGDPVRLYLETVVAIIIQQRELIDWSAKQNLLAYASGEYLDHLGIFLGVTRIPPAAALATIRFSLSAKQTFSVLIPAGTRVTAGDNVQFTVTKSGEIKAGNLSVDVGAQCVSIGTVGNGYASGQINRIVDPTPYVATVSNVGVTSGGSAAEDDEHLRERIRLAPESFSVAGSRGSYEFWARSAHQGIMDVSVDGPSSEPGKVYIYPLMVGGVIPEQEVLDLVTAVCSSEKVRPLTDNVIVKAPEKITYTTNVKYWLSRSDSTTAVERQSAIAQAVTAYELWQRSKPGRDIIPSELVARMMRAGALRVQVTSPQHKVLTVSQVATPASDAVVAFGGLEDG